MARCQRAKVCRRPSVKTMLADPLPCQTISNPDRRGPDAPAERANDQHGNDRLDRVIPRTIVVRLHPVVVDPNVKCRKRRPRNERDPGKAALSVRRIPAQVAKDRNTNDEKHDRRDDVSGHPRCCNERWNYQNRGSANGRFLRHRPKRSGGV